MLLIGVFSFTVGVTGLFGTKYLTPVLYMLVPITVCNIIKLILFWRISGAIVFEKLMNPKLVNFFKVFGIIEVINKCIAIVLIIFNITRLNKINEEKQLKKFNKSQNYRGVRDSRYIDPNSKMNMRDLVYTNTQGNA